MEESAFVKISANVQKAISACAANSLNVLFLVSMEANARVQTSADVRRNTGAITAKSQPHTERRNVRHVVSKHVSTEPANRTTRVSAIPAGTESFVKRKTRNGLRN